MCSSVFCNCNPTKMSDAQSWSLPLPKQQALYPLPPYRIRRDDRFKRQLYLKSLSQVQPNKALGILAQTVNNDDGKSVTSQKIFEKNIPTDKGECFLIDEVASKLYLIFRGTDRRGGQCYHLSISSLSFGKPDRFGDRRVTLSGKAGSMYKFKFGGTVIQSNFFLHPKTGELLFLLLSTHDDAFLQQVTGKLDLKNATLGTRKFGPQILDKFEIDSDVANSGLHMPSGFGFLNKRTLGVFSWSMRNNPKPPSQPMITSLKQNIYCDQQGLVRKISAIGSDYLNCSAGGGTSFSGHLFKYTMFYTDGGVALVKHFHRWMDSDNTKQSFLSFDTPNLFRQIHRECGEYISMECILGSKVYYTVMRQKNMRTLYRLELGNDFKDYRTCANCGVVETKKRQNANGKRIANFKVCRDCKQLKLHHQWWKFPCHFCSFECIKKGWRTLYLK